MPTLQDILDAVAQIAITVEQAADFGDWGSDSNPPAGGAVDYSLVVRQDQPPDSGTNHRKIEDLPMAEQSLVVRQAGDIVNKKISALTEEESPEAGDFLLAEESGGALRKVDVGNLPGGGGSWTDVTGKLVVRDVTITFPQGINATIPLMFFPLRMYPEGATIVYLSIKTFADSAYTAIFKERDVLNNLHDTIHTLATSSSKFAEVQDGNIDNPNMTAGRWLVLVVTDVAVDDLNVCIIARVNDP